MTPGKLEYEEVLTHLRIEDVLERDAELVVECTSVASAVMSHLWEEGQHLTDGSLTPHTHTERYRKNTT